MAHEHGLLCTPHSANVSMVTVFTMHLLSSIANPGPFLEFSIEEAGELGRLYEPALEVRDGAVAFPRETAGWGVVPHGDWLESAHEQVTSASAGA